MWEFSFDRWPLWFGLALVSRIEHHEAARRAYGEYRNRRARLEDLIAAGADLNGYARARGRFEEVGRILAIHADPARCPEKRHFAQDLARVFRSDVPDEDRLEAAESLALDFPRPVAFRRWKSAAGQRLQQEIQEEAAAEQIDPYDVLRRRVVSCMFEAVHGIEVSKDGGRPLPGIGELDYPRDVLEAARRVRAALNRLLTVSEEPIAVEAESASSQWAPIAPDEGIAILARLEADERAQRDRTVAALPTLTETERAALEAWLEGARTPVQLVGLRRGSRGT